MTPHCAKPYAFINNSRKQKKVKIHSLAKVHLLTFLIQMCYASLLNYRQLTII